MTNYQSLPEDCEWCPTCDGEGYVTTGMSLGTLDEPPSPLGYRCEVCNGEGVLVIDPEEPDEDFDAEPEFDDSMDGDAESALASVGWGTDEDYGSFGGDDF